MKRLLLVLMIVCGFGVTVLAQSSATEESNKVLTGKDSAMFYYMEAYLNQLREPEYQLFKTQNMWTFLKLNTRTGQIWQVQYSTKGSNYRFETPLDTQIRIIEGFHQDICGRFTLYPTDNMYNFILLDQINGRCWQVQWSTNEDERGIWRIN